MKKKTAYLKITGLLVAAALLLPVIFSAASVLLLPTAYEETFVAALPDKYHRLCAVDEPKILLLGGSSVAFGVDSGAIERETGYPVVDFGLYATLGTKLMLDLSEANIQSGDVILIMPELDPQTLSLYFNAEAAWQALEGDLSMLRFVGSDDYGALLAGFFPYIGERYDAFFAGVPVSPTGIYRRDVFNEHGDVACPRPYNVMTYGYDPGKTIDLTPGILSDDFIDYVNAYIDRAEHKGAICYWGFCPMNADALASGTDADSLYAFYQTLGERIHCEMLGNPEESILDPGYFFDTNFHLNDAGVTVHTTHIINHLLRELGQGRALTTPLPEPPGKEPAPVQDPEMTAEADPWETCFIGESNGEFVRLTGVTEAGRQLGALEIPRTYQGEPVMVVAEGTFAGCEKLTDVTFYENVTLIENGAFRDCPALMRIHMKRENSENLEVSADVFEGAPENLQIVLYTRTSFSNFVSGYNWALHAGRMVLAEE